ncbi:MAG: ROK family protein [Gaiella sp.]|uniref:ROK family protein n=1 Tax=Gaiella sp. TaxID=2663207 RepID=UPI002C143B2C|nr:ROK family protein [Gaiella sp.]
MPPDLVIGVDVGGTKMLAGVVARDGSVGRTIERPTSTAGQAALLEELDGLVADLLPEGSSAIGVGVPMNLDRRTGIGFGAVNLPLRSLDLAAHLQARFSIPVGVENDGNAIALAEWRVGAGQGANDLVALALGTGVGGGVIVDGRLYRGWAELGHVVVAADGPPCQGSCHGHGHLEAVASGEAAERAAVELWGGGADAHRLVREAQDGHKAARSALSQIGHYLGAAIGSFANIFGPEVVVVGGGFGTAAWDFLSGPAEEAARREALHPADNELRIVQAALGDDAGLVGAGLVGFEALDGLR